MEIIDYFAIACQFLIVFDWIRLKYGENKQLTLIRSSTETIRELSKSNDRYFQLYLKEYESHTATQKGDSYGKVKAGIGSGSNRPN